MRGIGGSVPDQATKLVGVSGIRTNVSIGGPTSRYVRRNTRAVGAIVPRHAPRDSSIRTQENERDRTMHDGLMTDALDEAPRPGESGSGAARRSSRSSRLHATDRTRSSGRATACSARSSACPAGGLRGGTASPSRPGRPPRWRRASRSGRCRSSWSRAAGGAGPTGACAGSARPWPRWPTRRSRCGGADVAGPIIQEIFERRE
jgi:hypothetical protein